MPWVLVTCFSLAASQLPWPISPEDAASLRQVVLVHRHGARFPTKPTGKADIAWPIRTQFWESYKGHLTPVGSSQLQDLTMGHVVVLPEDIGIVLRQRYRRCHLDGEPGHGNLFDGVDRVDGRTLAVYTSNVQRTLQSAWAFLLGFVPLAAVFFAFRSERVFSDTARRAAGLPIYIEDAVRSDDRLFHEWKLDDGYETWRSKNVRESKFLLDAASQPCYQHLVDKLFDCSMQERLSPTRSMIERLIAAKDLDTQVAIEEAHNRPVLINEKGIVLNDRERDMLQEIGNEDTTLSALATHLGLELPNIGFGAFLAFELHQHDGHFAVKTFYNSTPSDGASSYSLRSLALPLGEEHLVKVEDCDSGAVTLSDFSAHCEIPGVEETFQSFLSLCSSSKTRPTRKALRDLFETSNGHAWISLEKWRERYGSAFRCFDSDNDGKLSCEEVQSALAEWGYGVSRGTLEALFQLVDSSADGEFDEEDLHLTMSALVGIRGGLHGMDQLDST
eukprot:Skav222816  [mRNA]  locus=scaffold1444:182055:184584:+ [translate_table: standard]